jgi:hypothetical protein
MRILSVTEHQGGGGQGGVVEGGSYVVDEVGVLELAGRQVDTDVEGVVSDPP